MTSTADELAAIPRVCRVCDQALRAVHGPRGVPWMECPRWPYGGAHWWSGRTPFEHDRIHITDRQYDLILPVLIAEYRDAIRPIAQEHTPV